jgi:hypothetical protein
MPEGYRTRKRARASCCFSIFAKAAGSVASPGYGPSIRAVSGRDVAVLFGGPPP